MKGTKELNSKNKTPKKTNGITLIALIITIILMLILASVTITVAINGGLFEYAGGAKDSAEIANEKDIVSEAFAWAESNSKTGRVTVDELQKNIGTEKPTTVIDNGDSLVVKFNDSNRYYEVETSGKVEGPKEFMKEDYPGDLSKGGTCDGSLNKPFKITCIEDLVAVSIMTNGGNSDLGLPRHLFGNQYVELTRTLDFKSIFSYKDYTTKKYGDLNTDGKIEDIKTELTKTDVGCIGFPQIAYFGGTFNGKGNSIDNIYQNFVNKPAGLFSGIGIKKIENLNLSGNITSNDHAAGFSVAPPNIISNCKNYANITGENMVGGMVSDFYSSGKIESCENYGTIEVTEKKWAYSAGGGIVGYSTKDVIIKNCINYGKIIGNSSFSGGILGSLNEASEGECQIINCINKGTVDSGIYGCKWAGEITVLNSCNLGKVIYGITKHGHQDVTISNFFNAGECDNATFEDGTDINMTNIYYDQTKCKSAGVVTEGVVALNEEDIKNNKTFIQTLNNNIGTNTEWKSWKIGEDGWPTFE